ncbi:hypothetical protein SAMN05443634_106176 [Chishuiella changwenlii]|uniref:C1q domain-containing protein n=1 Tax=Chishuiella changwenlii TaxID=1434701 RepID=A0A1M6YBG0_9FLAO|nr:hypothetical protein [Chishuiella changwenlii]GGE97824.1 hypothetical protein GCM10010984_14220 [Chishuiella changwenlii]SHL15570.1 hypothetical protein SAMN05443634_106176 [Chishuiella changwenlii]
MKKIYLFLGSIFVAIQLHAQVGVNTTSPNATLEVASSPTNTTQADGFIPPKLTGEQLKMKDGAYQTAQIGSIIYITAPVVTPSPKTVNVTTSGHYYFNGALWQEMKGVNADDAINGLTISENKIKLGGTLTDPTTTITTSLSNTLRLSGLQQGSVSEGKYLVLDELNNVKRVDNITNALSIPTPAIFILPTSITNFLSSAGAGGSQIVNFNLQKNVIPGLTFNTSTSVVSFQPGTYQITFVYEATHNIAGCTISSYFVDFPVDIVGSTTRQRIHGTSSHTEGNNSNHGGTISYTTTLTAPRTWEMRLGRGQSGNCGGTGMTLFAGSTEVVIFRLGD